MNGTGPSSPWKSASTFAHDLDGIITSTSVDSYSGVPDHKSCSKWMVDICNKRGFVIAKKNMLVSFVFVVTRA